MSADFQAGTPSLRKGMSFKKDVISGKRSKIMLSSQLASQEDMENTLDSR